MQLAFNLLIISNRCVFLEHTRIL